MPQLTEEGGIVLFHCCHNGLPLVNLLLGVDSRGVGVSVTCRARLQSNKNCYRTGSIKPAQMHASKMECNMGRLLCKQQEQRLLQAPVSSSIWRCRCFGAAAVR